MLLSARMLENVASVNDFNYVDQVRFTQGDALFVYFQLVDLNKDVNNQPSGKRFMPASGATLSVEVNTINDATTLTKIATQPYANDTSIWRIQILAGDNIAGTFTMKLALTQSGVVTRGVVNNSISIVSQTQAFC